VFVRHNYRKKKSNKKKSEYKLITSWMNIFTLNVMNNISPSYSKIQKRKQRTKFSQQHLSVLESEFSHSNFATNDKVKELARSTGLQSHIIKVIISCFAFLFTKYCSMIQAARVFLPETL
jgi:hypothetical protein